MRKKPLIPLVAILVIAVLAGFFVFPRGFGANIRPWRLGLDLVGGAHLTYEVDMTNVLDADRDSVLAGLRDVIERRVNLFGVSEPQVYSAKSGTSHRLIVELAGIQNVSEAIKEIGETPFLVFAEVNEGISTSTPVEEAFTQSELTGRYIVGASLIFDQVTGVPQISLVFNDDGARIFEQLTEKNIGKQIAVFLDGALVTAPVVQEKITGGRAQITGQFSLNEARDIVSRFNAGALPAPIGLISQQTVGATLGSDSLQKTLFAGAVGTLIIMLFMVLYYRALGLAAVLALLIYIPITLLVFKGVGVTMTLSGIAGIILSIGMAVDANILIFERTKEEVKKGMNRTLALEEGFKRAWLSIRDSNISTIITSIILYYFTTGFIKGFGLALLIGVLMSMFSAITVTRTILRVFSKN
jgi:protein-export membrane protein SecD